MQFFSFVKRLYLKRKKKNGNTPHKKLIKEITILPEI